MDERVEEEKRQRKGCLFGQRKYEGGIKGQIYGCMHEGRKKKDGFSTLMWSQATCVARRTFHPRALLNANKLHLWNI